MEYLDNIYFFFAPIPANPATFIKQREKFAVRDLFYLSATFLNSKRIHRNNLQNLPKSVILKINKKQKE